MEEQQPVNSVEESTPPQTEFVPSTSVGSLREIIGDVAAREFFDNLKKQRQQLEEIVIRRYGNVVAGDIRVGRRL